MDNTSIDLNKSPYYVTLDKGNHIAYVLSGVLDSAGVLLSYGSDITPITYNETSGFHAGPTAALNGTIHAVAADPRSHLVYAGNYFGEGIEEKYFGVQVYDPADNFKQCGFIPLPIPTTYDYTGLVTLQMGIHNNQLFVGVDNQSAAAGASGLVYIIDNFSGTPDIHTVEDIEPSGEGMQNFSFYENRLYFVNYNSKNLICIDIDKKAIISVTDVSDGGYAFPIATAISPSKHELYIAQLKGAASGSIKTMDVRSNPPSPIGQIPIQATGLFAIDIDDRAHFICGGSGVRDDFVTLVDTSTDKAVNTMPMDGAVYSVALDGDNHRAYIANATQKKVFCYARKFFPA